MTAELEVGQGSALVTGASSGIGNELARQIAADGHDVILTARREERLRDLAEELEGRHGIEATVVPQDLAEANAAGQLFEAVQEAGQEVQILANNAGVPVYGPFTETDFEDEELMMQVNMVALTALTKQFIGPMTDRGSGAVLNTASLYSFFPGPKKAVYAATKAYVLWFSRALAHEFADSGITVTALCPGPVETEYAQRGGVEESGALEGITNDPETVAIAGWEGLKNGQRIVLPSLFARYAAELTRVLPRRKVTDAGAQAAEEGSSWI
ncbi:MAG: SDR family NAD(P)-dependent oxidoreductase [Halobacteriales archaeon]